MVMENKKQLLLDAYQFRHAVRQFDSEKKINEDDFNTILETGRLSPSSLGLEPWKFLVIQNKDLRDELKPHSWGGYKTIRFSKSFCAYFGT